MQKSIQVIGPFFTNFSFARVNRGLAIAMSKLQNDVHLYCERETVDWYPTDAELEAKPDVKNLLLKERTITDVAIYNNFPKAITNPHNLKNLPGKLKFMYVAWEESIYPSHWVEEINSSLNGVMAASNFTKEILERSGVRVPIYVVPNALDNSLLDIQTQNYPIDTKKKFKFLHISTAKQRKGVDVLLKAYFKQFSSADDVTLVIKSFPGPDNEVDRLINELKTENSPEVIHINNPNLSEQELANLHASCDCEVYPTRAEGFGLPILEAMFFGTPVIVTNYSAHLDFCNEENSFLIKYKLDYAKDSELVNIGAKWAEPDQGDLEKLMREVLENRTEEYVLEKIKKAKEIAKTYTWENSAKTALKAITQFDTTENLKNEKLAVITPINDEGGISDYCWDLYKPIQAYFKDFYFIANSDIADRTAADENNVKRLWITGEEDFSETLKFIEDENINIIHIQYHSGSFYPPQSLNKLIKTLKDLEKKVFVTLHAVRNTNFDFIKEVENLSLADKVLIHNIDDFEYSKEKLKNTILYPHFNIEFKKRSREEILSQLDLNNSPIIATHGLLNTNKGIPEVISSIEILKKDYPNILLLCLNAVSSNNILASSLYNDCIRIIKEKDLEDNIRFFTDFLDDETIEIFLQASDLVVFNYSDVGESASAAVRKGLASLKPLIITKIKQFREFSDQCFIIEDNKPETIASAVLKLMKDESLKSDLVQKTKDYIEENNVTKKAVELLKIYTV